MKLRIRSRLLAVAGLLLVSVPSLAAVKPITTTTQAARAAASTLLIREDAQNAAYQFVFSPRDQVARLFGELAAATTFQALLLTPGGIVLDCPDSGTVTATLSNRRPRVLAIEWQQCAREDFGSLRVLNGPAEVVLLADTFTPTAVASIRFGDRGRDHVASLAYDATQPDVVDYTVYRNLRSTGYLPMQRLGDDAVFAGRYFARVSGFHRSVSYLPDYGSGEPSEEVYAHDFLLSTSGALLSGQSTHVGNSYGEEVSILTGEFNERYEEPATPTTPIARTVHKSYGGVGLRLAWGNDDARSRGYVSIDGVARVDYNQWWGFGCAKPDEFSYRTRTLLEYIREDYTGHMFDSGLLEINGNTTATYTASGTQPYVDRFGHVAINIPGVGHATYDVFGFVYGSELLLAGFCTP